MSTEHCYIACDLGADSGRVILGRLKDGKLTLEEVHRFSNGPVKVQGTLRWDVIRFFEELKAGMRKIADKKVAAESVSVDSWGVDYVYIKEGQPMLSLPYHYRDARTDPIFEASRKGKVAEEIFGETGIQFMPFNMLYQLIDDVERNGAIMEIAEKFLNIADYLNWLFSGVARAEESLASTTQIYNPTTKNWSGKLQQQFKIPAKIFPDIVSSGTKLGPMLAEVAAETGLENVTVVASCSHDTGSAVAAVPATGSDWAYLSSGTWSLIGVEQKTPIINEEARGLNFTNEIGYGGTIRFLKNIIGLWIMQESKRTWAREGKDLSYSEIEKLADAAEPFRSLINPNAARFYKPNDMPQKIASYCRETGQPVPETPGQFARCIYESLALNYHSAVGQIEGLTGRKIAKLHVVGGGSQSGLLNQFSADATGLPVYAGPVEATACGNLLIQALALGHLKDLAAVREVVRASFQIREYKPTGGAEWSKARSRFTALTLDT